MPDFEILIRMWVKDEEEESIAEMAQEMADGLEQTMRLEKAFRDIPDSESSGLLNVTYQQAFYHKEE